MRRTAWFQQSKRAWRTLVSAHCHAPTICTTTFQSVQKCKHILQTVADHPAAAPQHQQVAAAAPPQKSMLACIHSHSLLTPQSHACKADTMPSCRVRHSSHFVSRVSFILASQYRLRNQAATCRPASGMPGSTHTGSGCITGQQPAGPSCGSSDECICISGPPHPL